MCVACVLCVSVLWHSRTSALWHMADTALPTPARSYTGSHLPTAPCVPRCTCSAFCVVPHCSVVCTTPHCVCPAALLVWVGVRWRRWCVMCGVCCVLCGVRRWSVGGVVAGVWGGWSLATPGGGSCVLLPATPGWVSLPVVVGGPRHSWRRVPGAVPCDSWLGFAVGGGVCRRRCYQRAKAGMSTHR